MKRITKKDLTQKQTVTLGGFMAMGVDDKNRRELDFVCCEDVEAEAFAGSFSSFISVTEILQNAPKMKVCVMFPPPPLKNWLKHLKNSVQKPRRALTLQFKQQTIQNFSKLLMTCARSVLLTAFIFVNKNKILRYFR